MKPSTRELIELLRRFNAFAGYECRSVSTANARQGAANAHRFHRRISGRKYTRDLVSTFGPLL
jgi:hypothetical protein